ncbi:hypothetical protein BH11PSE9_BH11PSE9_28970 [soil metagenome]
MQASKITMPTRHEPITLKQRCLRILWPAFLAAGVLEMLVFAVIDPADLRWFGGPQIAWSAQAVYTVTFLIFWGAVSTAGAMTELLSVESDVLNAPGSNPGAQAGNDISRRSR